MRLSLFAAAALLSASLAAHADTVFNVNTVMQSGTLTGTLTLNATSTAFDVIDLHFVDGNIDAFYTQFQDQGQGTTAYVIESLYAQNLVGLSQLRLALQVTSLDGYRGSALCSASVSCPSPGGGQYTSGYADLQPFFSDVVSGSLDLAPPASSVTPEPSSFALLGTGLFGVAGALKRRYA